MDKINELDKKLDVLEKILSLAFKFGILIGGSVLIFYCRKIDYFPQDISVGDGLLFMLLAIAFGVVYLFFLLCLTSLGLSLRPVWHGLQNLFLLLLKGYKRITGKTVSYTPFTIEKGGFELFIFAMFGLFFIWRFSLSDANVLPTLGLSTWGCALLWSTYQQNAREIDLLKHGGNLSDDESKRFKRLAAYQPFILGTILFVPLLIGGVSGKLLEGAMRLANVKADGAIIHLKEPYIKYATEHGLKGLQSNFGNGYSKFENISILFNGFGKDIVIEAMGTDGPVSLVIPSDHAYIVHH